MSYVLLISWRFANEHLSNSQILEEYGAWAAAAKENKTYEPSKPISLEGYCMNHPDPRIPVDPDKTVESDSDPLMRRGYVKITTSSVKTIDSLLDIGVLRDLGIDASHNAFVVETISDSPVKYVIDLEDADRS